MKTKKDIVKEIQDELLDEIDKMFPKIKPQGINKGRGEAAVLVGIALARFTKALQQQQAEFRKKVEGMRVGKRPTWDDGDPQWWDECSEGYNQALDSLLTKLNK